MAERRGQPRRGPGFRSPSPTEARRLDRVAGSLGPESGSASSGPRFRLPGCGAWGHADPTHASNADQDNELRMRNPNLLVHYQGSGSSLSQGCAPFPSETAPISLQSLISIFERSLVM